MAQLWSTGPVHLFVNIGVVGVPTSNATGVVLYLGTGERAPDIDVHPEYAPVANDIGGSAKFDSMYGGSLGRVSVVLTRYNEAVLALLEDISGSVPGSTRGVDDPGDIGTLMVTEGAAYGLITQFPYAAKAAYTLMPAGYNFFAAFLTQDRIQTGTTQAKKAALTWECLRVFDVSSQKLGLYSNILPALPLID